MLSNINQPIVAGLLGASFAGIVGATALPFNDRIEYRIANRIESQPAWLVPEKAEFRSIERGYGGIKILLALLAAGGMTTAMLIARKEGKLEPVRQRIKQYENRAYEFGHAAKSAYQMSTTATRYKKLAEADERAFEDELETAYCESLGINPQEQQALLTGTATLESVTNPSDKVESTAAPAPAIESPRRTPGEQLLVDLAYSDKSMVLAGSTGAGKSHTLSEWLRSVYSQARAKAQTASVWILGRKDDSFCGLREAGKLTIFKALDPTKAFKLIEDFHKNFTARLENISETDRKHLPPLRLILEDWSSIVAIFKSHYKQLWSKISLMLLDIITVGRDYNVCLLVLAQSLNLEALGLVGDANLRANMAIVAQGLITVTDDGKTKGDYLLVELSIKNQYIVSDNAQRATLLAKVNGLIPESKAKQIPIFFTTLGNENVGLLPHIEKTAINFTPEERNNQLDFNVEKFRQYLIQREPGTATQTTQTAVIERHEMTRDEIIASLNRLYKPDETEPTCPPDSTDGDTPESETVSGAFQNVKRPDGNSFSDYETVCFTSFKLDRDKAIELIQRLKHEMKHNQTEIIWMLWNARPGKTKAYEKALGEYKELTGQEEDNAQ